MWFGLGGSARAARALVTALAHSRAAPASRSADEAASPLSPPTLIAVSEELGRALRRSRSRLPLRVIEDSEDQRRRRRKRRELAPVDGAAAEAAPAAALVASITSAQGLAARLARWAAAVRDGGVIAVASPAAALLRRPLPAEVLTQAFVHAALIDIEQRRSGRMRVTLGRVRLAARQGPVGRGR